MFCNNFIIMSVYMFTLLYKQRVHIIMKIWERIVEKTKWWRRLNLSTFFISRNTIIINSLKKKLLELNFHFFAASLTMMGWWHMMTMPPRWQEEWATLMTVKLHFDKNTIINSRKKSVHGKIHFISQS